MKNDPANAAPVREREISRALPIALLRARETVMVPIRDMLADADISEQKWRILRALDEHGVLEQSAIAREACLLMPSVTRILRAMEAAGQVTRVADVEDKRRILVRITTAGRDLITENMPRSNQIHRTIEAEFGQAKLDRLLDLLEELRNIRI